MVLCLAVVERCDQPCTDPLGVRLGGVAQAKRLDKVDRHAYQQAEKDGQAEVERADRESAA